MRIINKGVNKIELTMIYYDVSESREGSRLPKDVVEYGKPFPELEKITGADFMIVPESGNYEKALALQEEGKSLFEIAKALEIELDKLVELLNDKESVLFNWLFSGAMLVQRKSGFDFVASMGSRLNESIARMYESTQKQYQKVILVTGVFGKTGSLLTINGKKTEWTYASFEGAYSSIKFKGACVEFIPSDDCILDWIKVQESQMMKYKHSDIKWVVPTVYYPPDMPEVDDPLLLMRPVKDARLSMVNIPGWGNEKVNALHDYVKECLGIQIHPSLLELLVYATAWETASHLKGVGKTLIKNAREYVGLDDGEYIFISDGNVTVQKGEV